MRVAGGHLDRPGPVGWDGAVAIDALTYAFEGRRPVLAGDASRASPVGSARRGSAGSLSGGL
ncbi:hypothetical protein [Streptomyces sp. NBC_01216]|uniref:hypothetical protein n=1 Tax=unclassified Streptomyces TaxID=2593676 RepID=UPI002E15D08E|nr:hypothetical protein OG393_28820 [Streptomyces sp. NBC_01216]